MTPQLLALLSALSFAIAAITVQQGLEYSTCATARFISRMLQAAHGELERIVV